MPRTQITKLEKMMALGQYIHWADLQYEYRKQLREDCAPSVFIAVMSHWIASQYVVIEGWLKLAESDATIEDLLKCYPDHVDICRRCRNAVYHYQSKVLDERIKTCLAEEEHYTWLVAIKWECERFLYLYPFKEFGLHEESVKLSEEYFRIIGWTPTGNLWGKWFRTLTNCQEYLINVEQKKLGRSRGAAEKIDFNNGKSPKSPKPKINRPVSVR